ncbi:MAG: 2Fe-2S iron-sulfur cluster binding domain-containing protein [Gammaproteobacteria bacterium]|nr:2Fe-2S iron-sulfur cluster binding domain-containing protein [Gammaproteobacteria bacterium]
MFYITYNETKYECRENETVLDCFIRHGVKVPFSCRGGVCRVCLMKSDGEAVPVAAKEGIRPDLLDKNYFLPCQCYPQSDMNTFAPDISALYSRATIFDKKMLSPDVCQVFIQTASPLYYHAGQFINLKNNGGMIRSYSLASVPFKSAFLELHIKKYAEGKFSTWLHNELEIGDAIDFQGPIGHCFYQAAHVHKPMLLIAAGTGLSSVVGIARDALYSNHQDDIFLYHGARTKTDLYFHDELNELSRNYKNFHYTPCLSDKPGNSDGIRVDDTAFSRHCHLEDWSVYLAGHPEMVHSATNRALKYGVDPKCLFADPYEFGDRLNRNVQTAEQDNQPLPEPDWPDPAPDVWEALDNGKLLTKILNDFYTLVFSDPKLAPFFKNLTVTRLVEKQYSFLYRLLTGERVYFGERPKNAHHWMVISDELFDYRERLFFSCCEKHGLALNVIDKLRAIDESFRKYIVKSQPWKKVLNGVELPLEGYEKIDISIGSLCDGCGNEIAAGEKVSYHVRLGTLYCSTCI